MKRFLGLLLLSAALHGSAFTPPEDAPIREVWLTEPWLVEDYASPEEPALADESGAKNASQKEEEAIIDEIVKEVAPLMQQEDDDRDSWLDRQKEHEELVVAGEPVDSRKAVYALSAIGAIMAGIILYDSYFYPADA